MIITTTPKAWNGEDVLVCPVCEGTGTHLLHVKEFPEEQRDRFSVGLWFACESGHSFTMAFRQYKGATFVSDKVPELTPDDVVRIAAFGDPDRVYTS